MKYLRPRLPEKEIELCLDLFDKQEAKKRILKYIEGVFDDAESQLKNCFIHDVSDSLRYSEREVDFAYLCGVFNTSGIDGLHTEIQRLKELGKEPHDIIEACRKQ